MRKITPEYKEELASQWAYVCEKEASKILGIELLDHIIIGNGYYSYQENDRLGLF